MKSVLGRHGYGAGGGPQTGLPELNTTAARPLPVASMVVVEGLAHCTCTFGQMKIRSGYVPAATWMVARLADIDGVAEAYSVTGEWDFVAIVRVPRHEQLAEIITGQLTALDGVARTQTMAQPQVLTQPVEHELAAET